LANYISWSLARNVNPNARTNGTRSHNKGTIEKTVEWVFNDVEPVTGWADVISKTTNGCRMTCHVIFLPFTNKRDEVVAFEFSVKHLTHEI
jgi:hypothetical protein